MAVRREVQLRYPTTHTQASLTAVRSKDYDHDPDGSSMSQRSMMTRPSAVTHSGARKPPTRSEIFGLRRKAPIISQTDIPQSSVLLKRHRPKCLANGPRKPACQWGIGKRERCEVLSISTRVTVSFGPGCSAALSWMVA